MSRIDPTSLTGGRGGSMSLEVRWIRHGRIPQAMVAWTVPFAAWVERREDRYLVDPTAPDLGVKVKGGTELDLKAFRGDLGVLEVPGGGRGAIERWEKWRFPLSTVALPPADGSSWVALWKTRHRRSFRLSGDELVERPVSEAELAGCSVELTEFTVGSDTWWTIALEAGGGSEDLEQTLRATAEAVFRGPRPSGLRFELEDSMSYPRWLASRSGQAR
ncbi:MAG: hypothetical protein ACXWW9_08865 [Actinomycetota bacterium]